MRRLDQALVERGLCESREKAKRAILAGEVRINANTAGKSSDSVKPSDQLTLAVPEKFVSRGGLKLEHALDHFKLEVQGLTAHRPRRFDRRFHGLPVAARRGQGLCCGRGPGPARLETAP